MNREKFLQKQRQRRKWRVRNRIFGTAERPRVSVYRSSKHIYVQVINDHEGCTLASASTLDPEFKQNQSGGSGKLAASEVGKLLAQRAKDRGVQKVAFDRHEYKYHGRVAALADALREGGLQF